MSLGMGLTFIPLTLTAVHHVQASDSGIGSGVLNTMQQVGGARGLATLSTIAQQVWSTKGDALADASQKAMEQLPPGAPTPSAAQLQALQEVAANQIYTAGATTAFIAGSVMVLVASVIIWTNLTVKHQELSTDEPEAVHVG